MAELTRESIKQFDEKVQGNTCPWLLAGIDIEEAGRSQVLSGAIGYIDWRLHGRVARLLKEKQVLQDQPILFPREARLHSASLLVFPQKPGQKELKQILLRIKQLKISEVCLIESSFTEEFCKSLKKSLTSASIQWKIL